VPCAPRRRACRAFRGGGAARAHAGGDRDSGSDANVAPAEPVTTNRDDAGRSGDGDGRSPGRRGALIAALAAAAGSNITSGTDGAALAIPNGAGWASPEHVETHYTLDSFGRYVGGFAIAVELVPTWMSSDMPGCQGLTKRERGLVGGQRRPLGPDVPGLLPGAVGVLQHDDSG
jgi:hypothetical protein